MKKIQKNLIVLLIVATLISCLYPVAIVGLILTIINDISYLMIICIVYLVIGFYAIPLIWINYGNNLELLKIVRAVYSDKLYDVASIASFVGNTEKNIESNIRKCIDKRYIVGFLFDGKTLTVNKRREEVAKRKCPDCGATLTEKDGVLTCDYCGFVYHTED